MRIELPRPTLIIPSMRHILLVLMIALLPVRGWVGDVMAAQMISDRLQPAAVAPAATETAHAECPGHAAMAAQAGAPQPEAASHESCASCVTCQVCASVALLQPTAAQQPAALPLERPATGGAQFASAEPAPGFKPPIS
jgi:hypothetical protein